MVRGEDQSPSSQSKMTKESGKEKVNKSKSNAKRALDTKKGPSKAKKSARATSQELKNKNEAEESEDLESNTEKLSDEDSLTLSESDKEEAESEEEEQPATKKNKNKNQSLKQRLTKYWERVRHPEKQILEDLFATIITDSHYKEKLKVKMGKVYNTQQKQGQ